MNKRQRKKVRKNQIIKACKCGAKFHEPNDSARIMIEGDLADGLYWECECKSTLFLKFDDCKQFFPLMGQAA